MPRKSVRKTNRGLTYEKDQLQTAVRAVLEGMSLRVAARTYGVPKNTIQRHSKGPVKNFGGETYFSSNQESALANRILYLSRRGFPITIDELLSATFTYARTLRRRKEIGSIPDCWAKNCKASYDWFEGFRNRNPSIALRIAENLSTARAEAFNPQRISDFFKEVKEQSAHLDIFDNFPNLVYNCDETGLSTVPNSSKKVLASKGGRVVQKIGAGERGTLTTLIPCANAIGQLIPPFLIFKGHGSVDASLYPPGTQIFYSQSGYIDQNIFLEFLKHFDEHRVHIPGKKCILFLDGHSSHITVESISFANEAGIEIFCLPPHSSHRLQPLDTHFNKPLKLKWSDEVSGFLRISDRVFLSKKEFHHPFCNTWSHMKNRYELIIKAFNYCGLFPLRNNTSSVDFDKCGAFISHEMNVSLVEDKENSLTSLEPTSSSAEPSSSGAFSGSHSSLPRRILLSPKKHTNITHTKKHVAFVTSPNFLENKKLKDLKDHQQNPQIKMILRIQKRNAVL